jgi:hypothetical protein
MNYKLLTATNSGTLTFNVATILDENQLVNIERINLVCDSTLNPIAIQLPAIADLRNFLNFELIVTDKSGTAATNNITITVGDAADDILGGSGIVLQNDNGKMHFCIASLTEWEVLISGCCTADPVSHTQFFDAETGPSVQTDFLIDESLPVLVVKDGVVLSQNTDGVIRDYAISTAGEGINSVITFTVELVAADIQVQYWEADTIIVPHP